MSSLTIENPISMPFQSAGGEFGSMAKTRLEKGLTTWRTSSLAASLCIHGQLRRVFQIDERLEAGTARLLTAIETRSRSACGNVVFDRNAMTLSLSPGTSRCDFRTPA